MVGLSDSTTLTTSVEIALIAMAIERLLSKPAGAASFALQLEKVLDVAVAQRVSALDPKSTRLASLTHAAGVINTMARITSSGKSSKHKVPADPSIVYYWAAEMYLRRNESTHGPSPHPLHRTWTDAELIRFGAAVVPVITHVLLQQAGLYCPDELGAGLHHALSHRLALDAGSSLEAEHALVRHYESEERVRRIGEYMKQQIRP